MNAQQSYSSETGSVVLQVAGIELFTRYSMNSVRATSVLSSLNEFRAQELEAVGNREWNWKYLREQFQQKSLEDLYRKYDNKLSEGYITIFLLLLLLFTFWHVVVILLFNWEKLGSWHPSYLALISYAFRLMVSWLAFCKHVYEPAKRRYYWAPVFISFVVLAVLVLTDIGVAIHGNTTEGTLLRPGFMIHALLACYVFLPLRNNYLAIIFGIIISLVYLVVVSLVSTVNYASEFYTIVSDLLCLIGVNALGVYFRLMNEIVTRRSFLDRRACVESTLKLNYEKDQEERLLLSILPEHIASRVRQDIRTTFLKIQSHNDSPTKKTLSQLYIEEHSDVSILYADVVNYTMISTTLPAIRMVELLNELFGRFDEASEEHEVLRIKFLGDCYYCVAGVPEPNAQHAKSCVDLGLDMISIIKDVREKRSLNIDMRIGVHTGKILSGLIGISKWQYDIWSKDATIANKMESTGKPGKVHVTKQTLESMQESARDYIIEPNFDAQRDPFLMKNKIETYLLTRPKKSAYETNEYKSYRRVSVGLNKRVKAKQRLSGKLDNSRASLSRRRSTTFMENNLQAYHVMLQAADKQMQNEIENMPSGKLSGCFKADEHMDLITMMYRATKWEKSYILLADPLFKYYLVVCLLVLTLIILVNGVTTQWYTGFKWYTIVIFTLLLLGLILIQPLAWFQFFWIMHNGAEEPRNALLRFIYDISLSIIRSVHIRSTIYIVVSIMIATSAVLNVLGCDLEQVSDEFVTYHCVSHWHVTQTWILALLLCFLFTRVFFMFKWLMGILMTGFYLWLIWGSRTDLFAQDTSWNVGVDPRVAHSLAVLFLTISIYCIDRQTEYRNRLDHMWQQQLKEEQEEATTMLKVNTMLLQNILPAHVADIYLDVNRAPDELYYENYENVAVMFASLTDYKLGLDDDIDMGEKIALGILDQIISDFDRILLFGTSSQFQVEKIKIAGWTYMAACGLDPSRRDSVLSSTSFDSMLGCKGESAYERGLVITMVQFAAAMMMQLRNFNRGSFQSFEGMNLRVGISHGEVAAGVVGSQKPLYDIWGHAVNMASRMDSTGESGKIHVTEDTAIVLDDIGILTQFKGKTFVKGAGYIRTYFVPLDADFNLISKEQHISSLINENVVSKHSEFNKNEKVELTRTNSNKVQLSDDGDEESTESYDIYDTRF